ncbi:MAG: LPS-assembly protein LptD [Ignavibacteriae bacterium]|nr:LPS-assembly protein LptD [Ignavibacteriota bacterium]
MKAFAAIVFFISIQAFAQINDTTAVIPSDNYPVYTIDTTRSNPFLNELDTLISDQPEIIDTTEQKESGDIDAVIYASSTDSLTFDVKNKKMYIYGSGELKYKQSQLTGGEVVADFKTNTLNANGIIDTADSTGINYIQTPVLSEAGEEYEGFELKYNFKTQAGYISMAKNKEENSRYEGERVRKVNKDVYFIEDGIYTTCSQDPPHTHFSASKMKVIQGDKIIARWIFMHIGGVPIPIPLPFAVFPNETGRRSGVIIPTYGITSERGWYFKNFGYFLAINDYMDINLTGDYYTRGGFRVGSRFRYTKRYSFNGNLFFDYKFSKLGESNDPGGDRSRDWKIAIAHHQEFNPTTKIDANLSFQTGNYNQNNTFDYTSRLTKDINSSATLHKRWEGSGNSMSVNYQRSQNLENGNIREVLPSLNFNKPLSYPFADGTGKSKDKMWYEYLGYNYSGQFKNNRNKIDGNLKVRGGIQHNMNFSASPKLSYFSISPSFRYTEKWYNKRVKKSVVPIYDSADVFVKDSLVTEDIHDINMVRTYDASVSANTKIYGMFPVNSFGIDAIRHTVTPSISYNYRPDFSKESWGYYDEYTATDGRVVEYDKYGTEVFGGASSGESQSINFSIGNIFEMKTLKNPTDTTSEAQKIQLLNLNLSSGYNFAADSLRLSDLRLSYRTQIGDYLNLQGSSSYTFYDNIEGRTINTFLASKGRGLMRLTNLSFSLSTTLSGDKIAGEERTGIEDETLGEFEQMQRNDYIGIYDEPPADFTVPWNLSLNYNFNLDKRNPSMANIRSNIGGNLGINLTKNWKLTFNANYDLKEKKLLTPHITIYRDLECWEMNLQWYPTGSLRGFRFEIRLKAPELSDIKVNKAGGNVVAY